MVKLYPALLLPVLLGRRPVRVVTAFVAVCAVSYAPHVAAVGWDVLGYLPGYLAEEDYAGGGRYLLLDPVLPFGGVAATAVAGLLGLAVLVAVVRQVRRRPDDVAGPALVLLGAALLVATPVQPWYGLPLAVLAALAARPAWLAVTVAAYVAFFAVIPAGPSDEAAQAGSLAFAAALAAVVGARAWNAARADQPELVGPRGTSG